MEFNQDSINKMKEWCREYDGQEISDYEANEAWKRLREFFEILHEIDQRTKETRNFENKENACI